jgi:hypothetical protein
MPHPSHSSWFDHPNNIWWGVQFIRLLVIHSRKRDETGYWKIAVCGELALEEAVNLS